MTVETCAEWISEGYNISNGTNTHCKIIEEFKAD